MAGCNEMPCEVQKRIEFYQTRRSPAALFREFCSLASPITGTLGEAGELASPKRN